MTIKTLAVLFATAAVVIAQEKVTISGSTTIKPILEKAAEAFKTKRPDVAILIGGGGSSAGVKAVTAGQVAIGAASRDLKDKEKADCADLVATCIGQDGIAIVVHTKNSVAALTSAQLRDVYLGKVGNWKSLGGNDAPIEVVSIEGTHGTFDGFVEHLKIEGRFEGEGKERRVRFQPKDGAPGIACAVVPDHADALAAVMTRPNAIAFTPMPRAQKAALGGKVRMLSVDGVAPLAATVQDGTYPLRRSLNLVTKGQSVGAAKAFLDFCTSREGQALVQALDFIPLVGIAGATPSR